MSGSKTELDADALEAFLTTRLGEQVVEVEVLADGLNLILAVSTVTEEGAYVLRRPNKLRGTSYMNDLEREYRVLQQLQGTAVPAPAPVLFCEDESILDAPFFVMESLEGETVPLGSKLPARFRTPLARRLVAERLIDTVAEIHALDTAPFEDVCKRQPPRDKLARGIDRLDRAADETSREFPTLRAVGEWLRRNVPPEPTTTLIHGDFRPGNVLFAGNGRPKITGVLDWETAVLGDPLTEVGYLLLRWRDDSDPTPPLEGVETRYSDADANRRLRELNERGLCPFAVQPGSPTRRELVARYEAASGRSFENERFYRTYAAFSLASVWVDLHRLRVADGAESGREPFIEYVAAIAANIVDGEFER